jgi:PPOX class probable F420-dependent enzyme
VNVQPSRFGHRVKQRDIIRMTPEEVETFLEDQRTMTLCSMNRDGTIHAVAMGYGFLEGAIAFETKMKSQKVQNLRRNPTITCMVEDGESYPELRGVSIVGTAEIVEEPERLWGVGVSVFERYSGPFDETLRSAVQALMSNRVAIVVQPERIVSWDHRKLGLSSGSS